MTSITGRSALALSMVAPALALPKQAAAAEMYGPDAGKEILPGVLTGIRKALFTTAVALGVAIASYAMMPPSALAATPNICAILASSFTPNSPMQIKAAEHSILHQTMQRNISAACLQTRGKQGASRMTAPGQAGTSTKSAGAVVAFDVPGSTITRPIAINPAGAVAGAYDDAVGLIHSFLRTSDGTITPFDPPGATCNPSTPQVFAAFPTESTRRGL